MNQLTSLTKGVTTVKNFLTVLTAIALFGLVACEGPAGLAGKDGATGATGTKGTDAGFVYFDGFKADLKCATCHTPGIDTVFYTAGRKAEWENSGHNIGGNIDRNAVNCAGCHTTEGFLDRSKRNFVDQFVTKEMLHPSPPGCFACHAPHGTGNYSFRDTSAITLVSFVEGVANTNVNWGKSNLCMQCHQPRNVSVLSPKPDPTKTAVTDTITIATSRWYPHYTVQGQMLAGTGGLHFPGYTYTTPSISHTSFMNSKSLNCSDCHMQEPVGGGAVKAGGHTNKLKYFASGATTPTYLVYDCKKCHSDIPTNTLSEIAFEAYKNNTVSTIKKQIDTLANLLLDTAVVNKWNAGPKKAWITKTTDPITGEVSYGVNAAGGAAALKIRPAIRSGAIWNFMFVKHDDSKGIHNKAYAAMLLRASIDEMKKVN